MAIKKKSRVTASFNMSSLTDIIFLLLIFFMLTSSMVIPNALNLRLPGKSNTPTTSKTQPFDIKISRDGKYYVNNKRYTVTSIENALQKIKRIRKGRDVSIVITPNPNVANEYVVAIMDIAYRLKIDAVMSKPK